MVIFGARNFDLRDQHSIARFSPANGSIDEVAYLIRWSCYRLFRLSISILSDRFTSYGL